DQQEVASGAVLCQQRFGLRQDDRLDPFTQEGIAPLVQLLDRMRCENTEYKALVGVNIEAAVDVILIELIVGRLEFIAIDDALCDEEFTPQVIGVTPDEGVIEIKNCQCHDIPLQAWQG